jgi:hypothetical protein
MRQGHLWGPTSDAPPITIERYPVPKELRGLPAPSYIGRGRVAARVQQLRAQGCGASMVWNGRRFTWEVRYWKEDAQADPAVARRTRETLVEKGGRSPKSSRWRRRRRRLW